MQATRTSRKKVDMERGVGEQVVEQVRQATDIVELIGAYVDLRPAGSSFKARCPFHKEKTPSFHVSPERQLFHCFGCGVGGDVFSFVMKHDGLTFPEALEMLARRAGVAIPEKRAGEGPDRAQLVDAVRAAVRYYRGKLKGGAGGSARRYLADRGVPDRLLNSFYIGLAPGGGHALLDYLGKRFPVEVLVQAGLVGQGEGGGLYDRFRERIVIPILSVGGEPIGFGARALRPEVEPKYLNSPETAIYKKARILFGLPQARAVIKEQGCALVVEGYFDVLGLASAGIRHTVAPCGTAWTWQHAQLLLRYTRKPLFLFDGDRAGEKAAWRALEVTLPVHPDVGIIVLPSGKDPDDMVRQRLVDRLRELLAAPLTPVAFALEALDREGLDGHPRITKIAELLATVGSAVAREMMVDEAAGRARLPAKILRQEVERLTARNLGRGLRRGGADSPGPQAATEIVRLTPLEQAILRLAQSEPSCAEKLCEASRGVPAVRGAIRDVLVWVRDRAQAGPVPEPPEMLRRVQAELGEDVSIGFLLDESAPALSDQFREDLLRHLREQALEAEMEALGYEIRALEAEGDRAEKLPDLLQRKQSLARNLARLREPGGSVRA